MPVPPAFTWWCHQEARKAAAEQCRKVPAVSKTRYPPYCDAICCLEVGTPHAPGDLAFQRWGAVSRLAFSHFLTALIVSDGTSKAQQLAATLRLKPHGLQAQSAQLKPS